MKVPLLLLSLGLASVSLGAPPPPKKPAPKPQPTVKDMAISEARKCDKDYNGRINGTEVLSLQQAAKAPKSFLYLFDDNSNGSLDSAEIANMRFSPAPKPKPKPLAGAPKSGAKKK